MGAEKPIPLNARITPGVMVIGVTEFPLKRLAETLEKMRNHPHLGNYDLDLLDDRLTNHLLKIIGNQLCMSTVTVAVPERRRRRKAHTERQKSYARRQVHEAVRKGTLIKPFECEHCGKHFPRDLLHGHHEDYSKPLAVKWLCIACHAQVHTEVEVQVYRPVRKVRVLLP